MPAPHYHPLVLTPTSYSRTSARPVCSGRALYAPRARGLGELVEGWMARTVRRGRRPQRLPKIVVRASRQLGFIGWYFTKDCKAYDSCACCSDKNRNLDVVGVLWERFDLAARLFSSRRNVDKDFPAREGQSGESLENGVKRREGKGREGAERDEREGKESETKERRQIITYIRVISDSRNVVQLLVSVSGMKLRFRVSRNW
ncbi:hypothetical protein ALC56_09614 [Trachymyrmex septentrionalis]|uniref:Uncharacterized protein n=1 Tax=Trachymyrmex septentrionalis TaxID=34720 RepID=A0A195F7B7_9HYME|nr:hypothetical protein ALC56_09614 [Trachymyrmex septentrionalis]